MEELYQEGHGGYGHKGRNVLGGILLGAQPVPARMPDIPCVFGVTDDDDDDDQGMFSGFIV